MASGVIDKDRGWAEILRASQSLSGGAFAKVGVLANNDRGGLHKVNPETGKSEALTVAEIAVVNEFGTADGKIPARSFVRATHDRMREELAKDSAKLIARIVLDRNITVEAALNLLGLKLASGIRSYITSGTGVPPPNAPSTAARKEAKGAWNKGGKAQAAGHGVRTLVDTSTMLNALSWAVTIGGTEKAANFVSGGKKG